MITEPVTGFKTLTESITGVSGGVLSASPENDNRIKRRDTIYNNLHIFYIFPATISNMESG